MKGELVLIARQGEAIYMNGNDLQKLRGLLMLLNEKRAEALMDKYGLDVLVATVPENVTYVTEIPRIPSCMDAIDSFAVLPREKALEPALIISTVALDMYATSSSTITDVKCYNPFYYANVENADRNRLSLQERKLVESYSKRPPYVGIVEALVETLSERGLSESRIGLDESRVDWTTFEKIRKALPKANLTQAKSVFREIRAVKTTEEINRIRKSVAINEKALKAVLEAIEEGVLNKDLQEIYRSVVAQEGADEGMGVAAISTGADGVFPNCPPSDHILNKGDVIRLDLNVYYNYYYSDIARSAVLGPPSRKAKECCEAIVEGIREEEAMIRPGARPSKLYEAALDVVARRIPNFKRRHCGHGCGLEIGEYPLIAPDEVGVVEEGMMLCLEAPYYELGFGSLSVEEMVLVTKKGSIRLSKSEAELYVI